MLTAAGAHVRHRRRAALAHQCPSCRQVWALHVVHGAAGQLVLCRYCGTPRGALLAPGGRADGAAGRPLHLDRPPVPALP